MTAPMDEVTKRMQAKESEGSQAERSSAVEISHTVVRTDPGHSIRQQVTASCRCLGQDWPSTKHHHHANSGPCSDEQGGKTPTHTVCHDADRLIQ